MYGMITRRHALAAIGVLMTQATVGWAQTASGPRRVARFGLGPLDAPSPYLEALREELPHLGWGEGKNLTLPRFTPTRAPDDFEEVAREILAAKPDVVVTQEYTVYAMHQIQATVPVVFGFSGDPVDGKLVQSFAHQLLTQPARSLRRAAANRPVQLVPPRPLR